MLIYFWFAPEEQSVKKFDIEARTFFIMNVLF